MFKFIDYVQDRRKEVPLKDISKQPIQCVVKALFFKLKADYLRYIYECLSGDNGLLAGDKKKRSFVEEIERRKKREIAEGDDADYGDNSKEQTLLEFMADAVESEYEEAKVMIFTEDFKMQKHPLKEGVNEHATAPFHPVFLSSLMNQQVFMRDVMLQNVRERITAFRHKQQEKQGDKKCDPDQIQEIHGANEETDVAIDKYRKDENQKIIDFIQKWLNNIEVTNSFSTLQSDEDRTTAWNLFELLEKSIT